MTLQGDLKSFALPDVLRLLAGTGKSGLLQVAGVAAEGELSLREGAILHGAASTAPRAADPADVVFELLRLDQGTFSFDEGDQVADGPGTQVEDALARAEAMLAEWLDVETVVPSMDAWISLSADGQHGDVHLDVSGWQVVVAVAGGGSVHDVAAALQLSDLEASQAVKGLAEEGLLEVGPPHAAATASTEFDAYEAFESFESFESFDHHAARGDASLTGLEDLVVEDRPVVMEDRDDALLPEPLPGEGVAFEGEAFTGTVDRRAFELSEYDHAEPAYAEAADVAELEEPGDATPFPEDEAGVEFASATSADFEVPEQGEPADDERGSLLRFLSSVKP